MEFRRPIALTAGIVLLALGSLGNIASLGIPMEEEGPPAAVLWSGVVLGILGLAAAVGLWQRRRWALWLAGVVLVLSIVSAAPGIPFAPNSALRIASLVGLIAGVVNLVLLLRPDSRAALGA